MAAARKTAEFQRWTMSLLFLYGTESVWLYRQIGSVWFAKRCVFFIKMLILEVGLSKRQSQQYSVPVVQVAGEIMYNVDDDGWGF